MRFIFTRDNLKKLTPSVRPVVANGKMVGLTDVDEPKAYIVSGRVGVGRGRSNLSGM